MRVGPQREERELLGLLGGGLGELDAAVADLDHEQTRQTVEVTLAVDVVDVRALTSDDHRHVRPVVSAVTGEVHPEIVLRGLKNAGHRNLPYVIGALPSLPVLQGFAK